MPARNDSTDDMTIRRGMHRRERGATAVEYALIVSLIAAVVAATVALVGTDALNNWTFTW